MENVIDITNKFLDQIQALLTMAEKEVIRKPKLEKEPSLEMLFGLILDYKELQIMRRKIESGTQENEKLSEEDIDFVLKVEERLLEDKIIKHLVENINLVEDGEDLLIETASPLTSSLLKNYSKNRRYVNTENELYLNSLIMSLVTSFELLVSDLIKDYALSNKNPNYFNAERIDYKTLTEIGDVVTAKEYLIDRYLEGVLRGGVTDWLKELGSISNNINFKELSSLEKLLIETFQRRHLLVHNNGIVNNLYLSKVDSSLTKELVKDIQLENSKEYIEDRINTFREIGILLSYKYFTTVYKDQKNEIYLAFQEHIIHRIPKDCKAAEAIFNIVMKDNKYQESLKLLAKINYWLLKKFNETFHEVQDEVEKFDVETLQPQFQMAKHLLLGENEKGFSKFIEYSKNVGIDELFYAFEWPILKLLAGDERLLEFKRTTIDSLFKEEEEILVE